jgi:hypothetical protein
MVDPTTVSMGSEWLEIVSRVWDKNAALVILWAIITGRLVVGREHLRVLRERDEFKAIALGGIKTIGKAIDLTRREDA